MNVASSDRTEQVCRDLRENEGLWMAVSSHVTKGASQVALYRWRKRWMAQEDGREFRGKVREIDEDSDKPWALLLAYRPRLEVQP